MNEFESDWISLIQSQSGVRVFFEWICEKITRCLNPRWQCLNPRWQNSRWLPSSRGVRMNVWKFFCANGCIQDGRIQNGCHHQVESEWMNEVFLCNMVESKIDTIQDGCHQQINQIELGCVRVRVEWECFWINLRGDNKGSEAIMAVFKMAAIIKLSQNEWVKFLFCGNGDKGSMSEVFFCANGGNQSLQVWVSFRVNTKMAESKMAKFMMVKFKMATFIKLGENEWVWVRLNYVVSESEWSESVFEWIWEKITRCLNARWQCLNPRWQNSRWLPSSIWVRMNEWSFFCEKWLNSR